VRTIIGASLYLNAPPVPFQAERYGLATVNKATEQQDDDDDGVQVGINWKWKTESAECETRNTAFGDRRWRPAALVAVVGHVRNEDLDESGSTRCSDENVRGRSSRDCIFQNFIFFHFKK
jgi:hypothetical protein